jgi:hypothetical protein
LQLFKVNLRREKNSEILPSSPLPAGEREGVRGNFKYLEERRC